MKNIYLLVGASGSGKTITQEILTQQHNLIPLASYTTRPPRFNGEDNHTFVSDDEFDKLTNIVAYTERYGSRYCATVEQVEQSDLYTIDPKGIDYFKETYKGTKDIKIILFNSPVHTRITRMEGRNDDFNAIMKRIEDDVLPYRDLESKADFIVENNDDTKLVDIERQIWNFIREQEKLAEDNNNE